MPTAQKNGDARQENAPVPSNLKSMAKSMAIRRKLRAQALVGLSSGQLVILFATSAKFAFCEMEFLP